MFRNKYIIIFTISILLLAHILWGYFHGGVPIHHVMANADLPGISNWWGMLTIPLLSFIVLSLIFKKIESEHTSKEYVRKMLTYFILSLLFGILLSACWELNMDYVMQYLILIPLLLSVFIKVHRPACLLGIVLGMVYTFGGVLPIVFGLVLLILSFMTHLVFNQGIRYLISKVK